MAEIPKIDPNSIDEEARRKAAEIASAVFDDVSDIDKPGAVPGAVEAPAGGDAAVVRSSTKMKVADALQELRKVKEGLAKAARSGKYRMSETDQAAFVAEVNRIHDEAKDRVLGQDVSEDHVRILEAVKERLLAEREKLGLSNPGGAQSDRGKRSPQPGKRKERLSIEELQKLSDKWIQETRELIPKIDTLAAAQALTGFKGDGARRKRAFNFPDELKPLFGKSIPVDIRRAFGEKVDALMEPWRKQVVEIYFDQPNVKEGFVKFLHDSFSALSGGKLNRGKFFSQYLGRLDFTGIEDLKGCDVLKDKLDTLWDKYYPGAEAQYKATGSGRKPERKKREKPSAPPLDADDAARQTPMNGRRVSDYENQKYLARLAADKSAGKATPEEPNVKERTYEELEKAMDSSELDELAGITGTSLKLALEYSRTSGKTKQTVIDELGGAHAVVEKILAPAISRVLPSDWSDAEKETFSRLFSQERVELFVKEKPKK